MKKHKRMPVASRQAHYNPKKERKEQRLLDEHYKQQEKQKEEMQNDTPIY